MSLRKLNRLSLPKADLTRHHAGWSGCSNLPVRHLDSRSLIESGTSCAGMTSQGHSVLCPYYSYEEIASSYAKGVRSRNDMGKGDQQVAPTIGHPHLASPVKGEGFIAPVFHLLSPVSRRVALVYACQYLSCAVIISLAVDFADGGLN
jgi:hypothetical protein